MMAQTALDGAPPRETGALQRFVSGFSIEATAKQLRRAEPLAGFLPPGARIHVPWLPRAPAADAVRACRAIAGQGFEPVPHLAARAIRSRGELEAHLGRFAAAGARALLLVAGDRRRAAGPFAHTLAVLDTGLLTRYGFRTLAIAGHPQGHPVADEPALMRALQQKQEYARQTGSTLCIVTQFAFDAAPIVDWLERLRAAGIRLPVRIGIPGPAKPRTLLRYALQCGVGASSAVLARRPDAAARLLGRWTPETMLPPLARYAADSPQVAGLHVFPFGGLLQAIDYFRKL